jgi:uncharacterized protein YgbK (DUF1537 family)
MELRQENENYKPIIVLDDDPTGTQTVHGVPVITEWSKEAIEREFKNQTPLFYILTNSRALVADEANELGLEIGQNIAQLNQDCWLISRGDSTLRGHFPNEIDALAQGLGWDDDFLTVLIPTFFEGNRLTKNDIHYLVEDNNWIPVGETPYAQDKTFGYHSSNLKDWVQEKTKGKIKANEVSSISIESLENQTDETIFNQIEIASKVLIVNALIKNHLDRFSRIIKASSRKIIFRTGASFVASFGEVSKKELLTKSDFEGENFQNGGLIVVGSHVPKSSAQLAELLKTQINSIEFEVDKYLINEKQYLEQISEELNRQLADNEDVVVFTSRSLKAGKSEEESLKISIKVSEGLISLVKNLQIKPRFFIAKGGITSSDLATKGLGVKRAIVLGQIEAGIPVWKLGSESKFPNMNYIVFPGNVGKDETLKEIYEKLQ